MSVNLLSKSDLLKSVSEKSGVSVKDSNAVISALADTVSEEVADGRTVQIIGIGRIARRWRAERTAKKPAERATGQGSCKMDPGDDLVIKVQESSRKLILRHNKIT